jgi:hypothetical protein
MADRSSPAHLAPHQLGCGLDQQPPLAANIDLGANHQLGHPEERGGALATVNHRQGPPSATADKSQNGEALGRAGGPPITGGPSPHHPMLHRVEPLSSGRPGNCHLGDTCPHALRPTRDAQRPPARHGAAAPASLRKASSGLLKRPAGVGSLPIDRVGTLHRYGRRETAPRRRTQGAVSHRVASPVQAPIANRALPGLMCGKRVSYAQRPLPPKPWSRWLASPQRGSPPEGAARHLNGPRRIGRSPIDRVAAHHRYVGLRNGARDLRSSDPAVASQPRRGVPTA